MKRKRDLINLLNLHYLHYTNKTVACGSLDLPALYCNTTVYPDFLALYREKSLYHKTDQTAVCMFEYDNAFDKQNGLCWSIYFNNIKRLDYFKKRFSNVKYIISPDYSLLGDIQKIENLHRIFRSRIVSLWFLFEIGASVIPNISLPDVDNYHCALDGLQDCSVVAFSTKGHMDDTSENERLRSIIKHTVDSLNLKAIVVYDVCGTDKQTIETFSYAINKDIKVIIPDNTLKQRNTARADRKAVKL